jgi:hyperosmotically inducible periplasmic protein
VYVNVQKWRQWASTLIVQESTFPHSARHHLNFRTASTSALLGVAVLTTAGCAASRGQESTGACSDDATNTTQAKRLMLADPNVAVTSINVETLNGTVMLSGLAKGAVDKDIVRCVVPD